MYNFVCKIIWFYIYTYYENNLLFFQDNDFNCFKCL